MNRVTCTYNPIDHGYRFTVIKVKVFISGIYTTVVGLIYHASFCFTVLIIGLALALVCIYG